MNLKSLLKALSYLKKYWGLILTLLAGVSLVYGYYHPKEKVVNAYVPVETIKEVEKIKKVFITVDKVQIIEKEKIVKVLELPEWVEKDTFIQITAAGTIKPYDWGTNVISLINTKSGEGSLISKQIPAPFFAFLNDNEIGIRAGYSTSFKMAYEGYFEHDFACLAGWRLGYYLEVNERPEARAMFQASKRY